MDDSTVADCERACLSRWLVGGVAAIALAASVEAAAKGPKANEVTGCVPSAEQVAFFREKDFKGACVVLGMGRYADHTALGFPNDQLSSMKVGSGRQVVICADRAFSGDCQILAADQPNLARTRIGNDKVSSAEVQVRGHQECAPGPRQVAVFKHREFVAPCEVMEIGDYPDLVTGPRPKAFVSSILVGPEVQAVLCRRPSFEGDCERFAASDERLSDNRLGNDKASSLKVQPHGLRECVPKADEAALFRHGEFLAPCVVKKVGDYANAAAIGLSDNSISSMSIGSAVQVCACENEAFGGECSRFVGEAPGVGSSIGVISSVRVQPAGAACTGAEPDRVTSPTPRETDQR